MDRCSSPESSLSLFFFPEVPLRATPDNKTSASSLVKLTKVIPPNDDILCGGEGVLSLLEGDLSPLASGVALGVIGDVEEVFRLEGEGRRAIDRESVPG